MPRRAPFRHCHYRTNLTLRQLAQLFGISPATVCLVIQRLGLLLALGPAPRPVADTERLWIVNGTLVPVRDRTVSAAASRGYRVSVNIQVIIDADTCLGIASAWPVANPWPPRPWLLRPYHPST